MDAVPDHYAVLGVTEAATTDEIEAAFRSLARRWHPDMNGQSAESIEMMKRLNDAKRILGDPDLRREYDRTRRTGKSGPDDEDADPVDGEPSIPIPDREVLDFGDLHPGDEVEEVVRIRAGGSWPIEIESRPTSGRLWIAILVGPDDDSDVVVDLHIKTRLPLGTPSGHSRDKVAVVFDGNAAEIDLVFNIVGATSPPSGPGSGTPATFAGGWKGIWVPGFGKAVAAFAAVVVLALIIHVAIGQHSAGSTTPQSHLGTPPSSISAPASTTTTTTISAAQSLPSIVAPNGTAGTFSSDGQGTAVYQSDSAYQARIGPAAQNGFTLVVPITATGPSALRNPSTSCVEVASAAGDITLPVMSADLPTDLAGNFQGSLTFALVVPGSYTFSYSCQSDYSSVPLGVFSEDVVGISVYPNGNYVAVVTTIAINSAGMTVGVVAAGAADLDGLNGACIQSPSRQVDGIGHVTYQSMTDSAALIAGVVGFQGASSGGFSYDCSNYPTINVG